MKNKLFIIATMLITGMNFAAADGNTPLSSDEMTFTIPNYIDIQVDGSSSFIGTATPTSKTNLTLDNNITVTFDVSSNAEFGAYILRALAKPTCDRVCFNVPALTQNSIVFTRDNNAYYSWDYVAGANEAGIYDILSGNPTAANNPNAIAFPIFCTHDGFGSEVEELDDDMLSDFIQMNVDDIVALDWYNDDYYERDSIKIFPSEGTSQVSCTISGSSIPGTFSMLDQPGDYSTSLILEFFNPEYL